MAYQSRKDLEREKRKLDREERSSGRGKKIAKGAAKIAGAIGVGYVAFKNADVLANSISKVIGPAGVTLSRQSDAVSYRGIISETKSLNKAFQDTYGNMTPSRLISVMANRKDRSSDFQQRIRENNHLLKEAKTLSRIPKDMAQSNDQLSNMRSIDYLARTETAKKVLSDTLKKDEYKELFGDKAGDVERVFNEHSNLLTKDLTRGIRIKDGQPEALPRDLIKTFNDYNLNDKKTVDFDIRGQEKRAEFLSNMFKVQREVQESVSSQVSAYGDLESSGNSIYAAYRKTFEYTQMAGLRQKHNINKDNFIDQAFKGQGFRNVSMGEATELYVERDPRTGVLRTSNKDSKNAQRFENLFNPRVSPGDGGERLSFARKYIDSGRQAGFDVNELKSDAFSRYIKINDKTGEILNTYGPEEVLNNGLDYLQDNYQVPFIRWNPLDATQRRYLQQQDNGVFSAIYRSGEVHAYADDLFSTVADVNKRNKGSVGVTDRPYLHIGDTIYDGTIAENLVGKSNKESFEYLNNQLESYKVADNQIILDVSYGRGKRHAEVLSGRTNNEFDAPTDELGILKNLAQQVWGGQQEDESNFGVVKRGFEKFESPYGPDNVLHSHLNTLNNPELSAAYLEEIDRKLSSRIVPLSRDAADSLHPSFADKINKSINLTEGAISPYDFDSDQGLWEIAKKISNTDTLDISDTGESLDAIEKSLYYKIRGVYERNKDNPDTYFKGKRFLGDAGLLTEQIQNELGETKQVAITKGDELRRMIEQYAISLYDQGMETEVIAETVKASNVLNPKSVLNEVDNLRSQSISSYFSSKSTSATTVQDLVRAQTEFQSTINPELFAPDANRPSFIEGMQGAISRAEPWYAGGFAEKEERLLKGTYATPIEKYKGLFNTTTEAFANRPETGDVLDDALHFGETAFDYLGQGFGWGGRTTSRSVIPWNIANNLDLRLQDVGLGLSNDLKQSPSQIMMNQFGRRVVLGYALYQQGKWADDMLFGGNITKGAMSTYANMRVDAAGFRETTGINRLTESLNTIMPWNDQLAETPLGIALNTVTFGGLYDTRDAEEMRYYYESGEDPIRKGRYWGVGSSGAYTGGRIDRYQPNLYRRVMSDYEYTDTMYGSKREYYANNPIPTLSHPFSTFRHLFTDPYHWENKHALSRPYAKTGGSQALQIIPVVGPAVDRVYSSIFKPQRTNPRLRRAHRQYQNQYSSSIAGDYLNMNAGGVAQFRPSGSVGLTSDTYSVSYDPSLGWLRDEDGYLDEEVLESDAVRFESEERAIRQALINESGRTDTFGRLNPMNLINPNRSSQNSIENYLSYQNSIVANQPMRREPYMSDAGRMGDPARVTNLNSVQDPNALFGRHGQIEGTMDSLASFGGMIGFTAKTLTGFGISDKRVRYLETSENFMDYTKRFYDMDLGGFPGDISEIGRRYVDDDKRGNLYNPIRNTMPDWMPGPEYFIDFKHGDPFGKVNRGEIRLPGESYETLYNVRKDSYGNYSAFDRYRVLADVAPYSDQYRMARKEVALLNQNGLLNERQQQEYADIRKQVTSKNTKKRFYERTFKNAKIDRETVTIKSVLDNNTFITEEYGDTPFKLAGVQVSQDDTEAIELIKQVIRPGERVQVGIDSDPQRRIRDDMLETSRVVVYAGRQNIFNPTGLSSGENLNYRLSQDPNITVRDDGSATATHALTAPGLITVGSLTERLVHDVLPNIPITNIITDVFMPVRSPVAQYRQELYSKDFRNWASPMDGWIKPMVERGTSINPALAALHGAGIGFLVGGRKNPMNKAWAFGAAFGVASGVRTMGDLVRGSENRWIPKRREKEREIDEYFDKIKYVKYKGLYEQAKEAAKQKEGIDLDAVLRDQKARGEENKGLQSYLKSKKKALNISAKSNPHGAEYAKEQLALVNEQIKELEADRPEMPVGSYAALALRYKNEFESTVYGAQETFDYMQIYRGLPKKDREYFAAFQKASPEERQEIIELVPSYQKRIFKTLFGMEAGEREELDEFFLRRNVPDADWEGWAPDVSLDNIKVKVMKNEGLDLTESNYWEDDEMLAEQSGVSEIDVSRSNPMLTSSLINRGKLKAALEGAGLEDVQIKMNTSKSDVAFFGVNLEVQKRREEEIEKGLRSYMQ